MKMYAAYGKKLCVIIIIVTGINLKKKTYNYVYKHYKNCEIKHISAHAKIREIDTYRKDNEARDRQCLTSLVNI